MIIGAELKSLKGTKLHEHALRFAFGGACTVLAGLIAQRYGPAVGGLFLAFPAIFPAGAGLIVKHEEEKKREMGRDGTRRGRILAGIDAKGAAMGALALAAFAVVVWRGLGSAGTIHTIAVAGTAWVFAAAALWGLYRLHRAARLRRARRRIKS